MIDSIRLHGQWLESPRVVGGLAMPYTMQPDDPEVGGVLTP